MTKPLNRTEVDEIIMFTNTAIQVLGWSKAFAKRFLESRYGCTHRLKMTDWQLGDFGETMRRAKHRKDKWCTHRSLNRQRKRRRKLKV